MAIGIRNFFRTTANQAVNTNIVPANITGLVVPVAASQVVHIDFVVPFSLGATGGFRFLIATPAAPTSNTAAYRVDDCTTANTFFAAVQTALAAFTNASAVAGNYIATISLDIVNGATAGNIALQFAQNNSTANNITILLGASANVVYL
jgi:hypothetical protein